MCSGTNISGVLFGQRRKVTSRGRGDGERFHKNFAWSDDFSLCHKKALFFMVNTSIKIPGLIVMLLIHLAPH